MEQPAKIIIFLIVYLQLSLFFSVNCRAQCKPWTLKGCMQYLNKTIDDTTKYDFKVTPFDYCYFKHAYGSGFRNEMGLWRSNPLTIHFKLRGIRHPDDMSSIIKQSFYRYLNNDPIKFREQKKKYKTYWKEIKEGRSYEDLYNELWGKDALPDSVLRIEYLKLFYPGRKVKGYFNVVGNIRRAETTTSFQDELVYYIAEVTKVHKSEIELSIVSVGQIEEGFEVADQFFKEKPKLRDIIKIDPCLVYLIPD
jgi:hypothetical protein